MSENTFAVCPPCIERIQKEIMRVTRETNAVEKDAEEEKMKEKKKDDKVTEATWNPFFGETEKASTEEIEECLGSLPYSVPICDSCKAQKHISIIKLGPNAFKIL